MFGSIISEQPKIKREYKYCWPVRKKMIYSEHQGIHSIEASKCICWQSPHLDACKALFLLLFVFLSVNLFVLLLFTV